MVEHDLAKVGVAGSSPVFRSLNIIYLGGEIGRHAGLKILWAAMSVRVQVPPEVQNPDSKESGFFVFTIIRIQENTIIFLRLK